MADGSATHVLNVSGEQLNTIIAKADSAITKNGENVYIPARRGGTGLTTIEKGSLLVGASDDMMDKIPALKGVFICNANNENPNYIAILPVEFGGTGVSNLNDLRDNLGLGNDTTQPVPVNKGGTGATNFNKNNVIISGENELKSVGGLKYQLLTIDTDGNIVFKDQNEVITQLGTITQGVWNGSVIPVLYGGTGVNSLDSLRQNLGLGGSVDEPVPISKGGTGATNTEDARKNLNINYNTLGTVGFENGGTGISANSLESLVSQLNIKYSQIRVEDDYVIPIEAGGTGVNNLTDLKENLNITLEDVLLTPLSIDKGGTGVANIGEFKQNLTLVPNDINGVFPIEKGGTGVSTQQGLRNILNYQIAPIDTSSIELNLDRNRRLLKVTTKSNIIIPENLGIIENGEIEVELDILRFGLGEVTISPKTANIHIYYAGASGPVDSVIIDKRYGKVTLKKIENNVWLVTGDIRMPTPPVVENT